MEEEKSEVKSSLPLLKWVPVFALGKELELTCEAVLAHAIRASSGLVTLGPLFEVFGLMLFPPVSEGFV